MPAFRACRDANAIRTVCRSLFGCWIYRRWDLYEYSFRMARRFSCIYYRHDSSTEDSESVMRRKS